MADEEGFKVFVQMPKESKMKGRLTEDSSTRNASQNSANIITGLDVDRYYVYALLIDLTVPEV